MGRLNLRASFKWAALGLAIVLAWPALFLGGFVVFVWSHGGGEEVSVDNQTDHGLYVFLGERDEGVRLELPPQSRTDFIEQERYWQPAVVVENLRGVVVSRQHVTWDELDKQDHQIVITTDDID